jgi:hypothetical protein
MKKKTHFSKRLILTILASTAFAIVATVIIAGFENEQTYEQAVDELRQRITDARELLENTHISADGTGKDVPYGEYWVTLEDYNAFSMAIETAEALLARAGMKNYLEAGGVRVLMSISYADENYIDVTLSLDSNPGIWCFSTDLVYDMDLLEPVSIDGYDDLQVFNITLPLVEQTRNPDRRVFIVLDLDVFHDTGLIATTRFKVKGELENGVLPVTLGHLDVAVYNPDYPAGMQNFYVSTNDEVLSYYNIPAPVQEYDTFSGSSVSRDRVLVGDVNNDRRVTTVDAQLIARYVVLINIRDKLGTFYTDAADVDNNGSIMLGDVTRLMRCLANFNDVHMYYMNMYYRILTSSDGGQQKLREAETVMVGVEDIFRRVLNINLIQKSSNMVSTLNMWGVCHRPEIWQICTPDPDDPEDKVFCGAPIETGQNCATRHHRAADYFVYVESGDANITKSVNTFRFVNFRLCWYRGGKHRSPIGAAVYKGTDTLVTSVHTLELTCAATVHEISHLLGADDIHNDNIKCVMNEREVSQSYVSDVWCNTCKNAILR